MKRSLMVMLCVVVSGSLVLIGADKPQKSGTLSGKATASSVRSTMLQPTAAPELSSTVAPEGEASASTESGAAAFQLNWYSINGGGAINASSTNFKMGLSVGQSVAGAGSSTNYNMGIGFWYGATAGGGGCPITLTGDVNVSGAITSADIIGLVNFVFKGGSSPLPCEAAGDVNCNGAVTSSDIIFLVNFVFKGGAVPCDACTSSLAAGC